MHHRFLPALLATCALLSARPGPLLAAQPAYMRLRMLERTPILRPQDTRLRNEWDNAQFILRKMRYALDAYRPSSDLEAMAQRHLNKAERLRAAVRAGRQPPLAPGLREEAYYCDADGSHQPFLRYLPKAAHDGKPRPLLVYLHGYSPLLDLVNWTAIEPALFDFAEEAGFMVVAPFGRSNTDFQNIGEHDVLRAIMEMKRRYNVDDERIVLAGFSMGGMGVWTIGARNPDVFAGLLPIAARGDYYFWHNVRREDMPCYKRTMIDFEFGHSMLDRLAKTPVFSLHGSDDRLIRVEEGRHMAHAVRQVNPNAIYRELPGEDHWIVGAAFARDDLRQWLRERRRPGAPREMRYDTALLPSPIGPVKRAFLSPFLFVCASEGPGPSIRLRRAAREWERFAKAAPRTALEYHLRPGDLARFNLFLFGEPERSALIRTVLATSPVTVETDRFRVGDRSFPRQGHGLYLARPNPWNHEKLAVVQCGIPWGEGLPENHKYDLLPDYIVYSARRDADGSNSALCAGFFDSNGQLDMTRQYLPTLDNAR